MRTRKNKICILAFIGSDNTGDEAILYSVISSIQSINNIINIFSFNPEKTKSLLKDLPNENIEIIDIKSHKKVMRKIMASDILICGGGGIIQDQTSFYNLPFFLSRVLFAGVLKKKIVFYGVGVGPLHSKFSKIITKFVLNRSKLITVRDKKSREILIDCGIKSNLVEVTADPAVSLGKIKKKEAQILLREQGVNIDRKIMVICLRQWFSIYRLIPVKLVKKFNIQTKKDKLKYEYFLKEISKFLEYCKDELKFQLVFLPFWKERDNKVNKEISKLMKNNDNIYILEKHYNPMEIKGIISLADFVLGMRLHSLIFASTEKRNFLAINYSPKVKNYLDLLVKNRPSIENIFINPENFSSEELKKKLDFIIKNKPYSSSSFTNQISKIVNQEKKNSYYLKKILKEE